VAADWTAWFEVRAVRSWSKSRGWALKTAAMSMGAEEGSLSEELNVVDSHWLATGEVGALRAEVGPAEEEPVDVQGLW